MNFKLSIDDANETLTMAGVPAFLDKSDSSHIWGNSRLTEFGLSRLFSTFFQGYIHSIHLRNKLGLLPPIAEYGQFVAGLWTCGFDSFFDESDG